MLDSRGVVWLAILTALPQLACSVESTEIILVIDSNLVVGDQIHAVLLITIGPSTLRETRTIPLQGEDAYSLPLSYSLAPEDEQRLTGVDITATALLGELEQVSQRVRTDFLRGQRLVLPMRLDHVCAGMDCELVDGCSAAHPDELGTCRAGACVCQYISPESLAVYSGSLEDAGGPPG